MLAPPGVTLSFGSASVAVGASVSFSVSITNLNCGAISNVAFDYALPSGFASLAVLSNTCGGSASVTGARIALSSASLLANGGCAVSFTLLTSTSGTLSISSVIVSSTAPSSTSGSVSLCVASGSLTVVKSYGAASVNPPGTTLLSILITNTNCAVSSIGFTDILPTGGASGTLVGVSLSSNSCGGGLKIIF